MKVLVCGGRDYKDQEIVNQILDHIHKSKKIDFIICGGAKGADTLGWNWAYNAGVPALVYMAQWDKYGKRAGSIRNQMMLDEQAPDLVVAFPGGTGTAHMVRITRNAGINVIEVKNEN